MDITLGTLQQGAGAVRPDLAAHEVLRVEPNDEVAQLKDTIVVMERYFLRSIM
jgi:hypothetical protein